jgi:hypothetical protein
MAHGSGVGVLTRACVPRVPRARRTPQLLDIAHGTVEAKEVLAAHRADRRTQRANARRAKSPAQPRRAARCRARRGSPATARETSSPSQSSQEPSPAAVRPDDPLPPPWQRTKCSGCRLRGHGAEDCPSLRQLVSISQLLRESDSGHLPRAWAVVGVVERKEEIRWGAQAGV